MFTTIRVEQSIVMEQQVRMLVLTDEIHQSVDQFAVLLIRCLSTDQTSILLDTPDRPQKDIGLVQLIHHDVRLLLLHEVIQRLDGCIHRLLEVLHLVNGQGETGQGHEHVTGTALEPRITGNDVGLAIPFVVELMGSIDQT